MLIPINVLTWPPKPCLNCGQQLRQAVTHPSQDTLPRQTVISIARIKREDSPIWVGIRECCYCLVDDLATCLPANPELMRPSRYHEALLVSPASGTSSKSPKSASHGKWTHTSARFRESHHAGC